jgi:hypothetical protein
VFITSEVSRGDYVFGIGNRNAQFSSLDAVRGELPDERAAALIGNQRHMVSERTTILMKLAAKFDLKLVKILWTVAVALAIALSAGARQRSEDVGRRPTQAHANEIVARPVSTPAAPESPAMGKQGEITSYVMDFDGDHSLDLATVVEQAIGEYSRYTVQLHLASGAEQSIAVTAPPGGLRLEMRDMTGDNVANDLVLRPALLQWLPTVLVNDGHDHFAVVISNHPPDSLSSGQEFESGGSDARGPAALMPSGFKAGGLTRGRELFPQLRALLLSPTTQAVFPRWEHPTSSGRAPPAPAILI